MSRDLGMFRFLYENFHKKFRDPVREALVHRSFLCVNISKIVLYELYETFHSNGLNILDIIKTAFIKGINQQIGRIYLFFKFENERVNVFMPFISNFNKTIHCFPYT